MEVLITISIVAMIMTSLFMLQGNSLRALYDYSKRIQLVFPMKNFLLEISMKASQKKEEKTSETKKIINPRATLTYNRKKVSKQSTLKDVKGLYVNEVVAKLPRAKGESIISFAFIPRKQSEVSKKGVM